MSNNYIVLQHTRILEFESWPSVTLNTTTKNTVEHKANICNRWKWGEKLVDHPFHIHKINIHGNLTLNSINGQCVANGIRLIKNSFAQKYLQHILILTTFHKSSATFNQKVKTIFTSHRYTNFGQQAIHNSNELTATSPCHYVPVFIGGPYNKSKFVLWYIITCLDS